jgi:hypothetical protein
VALGPRFALVALQVYLALSKKSSFAGAVVVFFSGLVRTFSCGGWVYITSSDDHDVHDILMIAYIVADLPWMIGGSLLAGEPSAVQKRCAEPKS